MIYETYEWTGKKKKGIYLKAGRFYLEIADRTKNGWYQIAEEQKMYLTKSFQLPCSIGYITQNQYRKIKKEYTREEVKKLAWHTLQRYEAVSYTHLDVYKRQHHMSLSFGCS